MKPAHALAALILAALMVALVVALPALDRDETGHGHMPRPPVQTVPFDEMPEGWDAAPTFDIIPLPALIDRIEGRFPGRLLAAKLTPPREAERQLGAELVYDLRLLTRGGDVLRLRIDARDGRFLDITGRDLSAAGKGPKQ